MIERCGVVRKIGDRAKALRKRDQSLRKTAQTFDGIQLTAVPRVNVEKMLVALCFGQYAIVYGIIPQLHGQLAAKYLPELSHVIPGVDPFDKAFPSTAIDAYRCAAGVKPMAFDWDYRASQMPDGSPKPGQTAAQIEHLRALQALDTRKRGIVTATREQVADQIAYMRSLT